MGTVAKTLKLLDFFSIDRPEIGLTQFVRLSGYDKATTHRRLTELVAAGFLEQDQQSRGYRLGPAVLRLAHVREQTFPARDAAMPALRRLSEATRETVHISLIQGREGLGTLANLGSTAHGMRVYVDDAELLPFHATASGITVLAFSSPELLEHVLDNSLPALTEDTITDAEVLKSRVYAAKSAGFGESLGGFESQVHGIAAPLFDRHGSCNGAVAVATPMSRMTEELQALIYTELKRAARDITHSWGGFLPESLLAAWGG